MENLNTKIKKLAENRCKICHTNKKTCIHHIDRNVRNNDIDNLTNLCPSCHYKDHSKDTRLKVCYVCGKKFKTLFRGRGRYCSNECKRWIRQNLKNNNELKKIMMKYRSIKRRELEYRKWVLKKKEDSLYWKERRKDIMIKRKKEQERLYLYLKNKYRTDNERITNFKWSRATYFRVKDEVEG